ncbi:MAG: FKBP-type peptidyl-prolyl cis-trans isomerase [Pedobacter sp.]|uniref:FKBP-type peptidyl-prolyl cis-trans isomerase n=1 Tax=Pedobacter sp. TaxID=1411316 RepID=UPI00339B0B7C
MLKSRNLLLVVLAASLYVACKTDPAYDKATQLAIDDDKIVNALKASEQTAAFTKDPSGVYYNIISAGEGIAPVIDDTLLIHYVGRTFPQGILFDSTATNVDSLSTKFVLADGIEGWQKGIPLIKPGGRIRLLIPSALGYQNRNLQNVDSALVENTNLDFDIRLISLKHKDNTKNK